MIKAIINNQLVTVKVLKEKKLFWLFEQVLVVYNKIEYWDDGTESTISNACKWIPKSNLIEE